MKVFWFATINDEQSFFGTARERDEAMEASICEKVREYAGEVSREEIEDYYRTGEEDRVRVKTVAPESYDGFGTFRRDGTAYVLPRHVEWQVMRYRSGLHGAEILSDPKGEGE